MVDCYLTDLKLKIKLVILVKIVGANACPHTTRMMAIKGASNIVHCAKEMGGWHGTCRDVPSSNGMHVPCVITEGGAHKETE